MAVAGVSDLDAVPEVRILTALCILRHRIGVAIASKWAP